MKTFHIELPDLQIREALIDKINNLTIFEAVIGGALDLFGLVEINRDNPLFDDFWLHKLQFPVRLLADVIPGITTNG